MNKPFRGLAVGVMLAAMGFVSSAFGGVSWTTGSYADDEYVEVANRLNGGSDQLYDGKTTTQKDVSNYASFTYSFDGPKDLTDVRIYSRWNDAGRVKFTTSNLWVRVSGSSDFVELPDSAVDCRSNVPSTNRLYAALSADNGGFIATRITAVRLSFDFASGYIGGAEIEVAGTSSVDEALVAEYEVDNGQLTATATATAALYPVDVYFCYGDTNGGDSTNGWENVTQVQTLTGPTDEASWTGSISFRFARFVFKSAAYADEWVWSGIGDVAQTPSATATIGAITHTNAALNVTIADTGVPTTTADIYLACGTTEDPTDYQLLAGGVVAGEHALEIKGLVEHTDYFYSVLVSNRCEKTCAVGGSFSTPWSPEELARPMGTAVVEDLRSARATVKITLDSAGVGSESADVWFASAAQGGEMPALTRIAQGVEAAGVVSKTVLDLAGSTTYDYCIVISNNLDRTRTINGSFMTALAPFVDPDTPASREIPYRALPSAYTQVEYLQSPETVGKWWINTGIKSKVTTLLDMDFMPYGSFPGDFVGQNIKDQPYDWRLHVQDGGRTIFDIGDYRVDRGKTFSLDTRYRMLMGYIDGKLQIAITSNCENVYTSSDSATKAGSQIQDVDFYIFACQNNYGNVSSTKMKLWSCVLKDDGETQRDFVPAIRAADGKPGLYDIVSGEFFTDSGDGTYGEFRTGSAVPGAGVEVSVDYSFTTKEWTMTFDVTSGAGALYAVVQDAEGNRKVALVKADAAAGDHIVHKLEIPVGDSYQIGYKLIAGDYKDYTFVKTTHQIPVGEIAAQNITMTNAEVVVTLAAAGELEPTSDLYFAYAKQGETMPALEKVATGMSDGMAYTNFCGNLDHSTAYDCVAIFSNSVYGSTSELTFSTRTPCNWHVGTFDPEDFELPAHWLSGGITQNWRDSKVSGGNWQLSATSTNTWDFAEAQDIYTIDFYFNSDADHKAGIAFGNILVKYEGAEDYVEIPNTSLDYVEGGDKATFHVSIDSLTGVIATNVVSVLVPAVQVNGSNTRLYESVMTGEASHREFVAWTLGECETNEFVRAADAILPGNELLKSYKNIAGVVADGDLNTKSGEVPTGYTYEWQFVKPCNVRAIELYSNGGNNNGNPDLPRSRIQVASVWAMFAGSTEWTQLAGGSYDIYCFGGQVKLARMGSCRGKKYALTDVLGVRVVMGAPSISYAPPYMGEVQLCGLKTSGFVIIVK